MRPTKVKAHKGNLFIFDIRLKNFVRQHFICAVCGPDCLESSSKFREISVCVTTYNRKAIWLHISLRSCFSGHFMSVSRAVTISPLVSIFCQRWPAIHMCSALKYRSHRLPNFMFRQRSSQIGVVLSRDRLVVPLSTRPSLILISNLIIDASSISTLIKFFSFPPSSPWVCIEQTLFYHLKLRNRPIVLF
jgi:hypothetical protein